MKTIVLLKKRKKEILLLILDKYLPQQLKDRLESTINGRQQRCLLGMAGGIKSDGRLKAACRAKALCAVERHSFNLPSDASQPFFPHHISLVVQLGSTVCLLGVQGCASPVLRLMQCTSQRHEVPTVEYCMRFHHREDLECQKHFYYAGGNSTYKKMQGLNRRALLRRYHNSLK